MRIPLSDEAPKKLPVPLQPFAPSGVSAGCEVPVAIAKHALFVEPRLGECSGIEPLPQFSTARPIGSSCSFNSSPADVFSL